MIGAIISVRAQREILFYLYSISYLGFMRCFHLFAGTLKSWENMTKSQTTTDSLGARAKQTTSPGKNYWSWTKCQSVNCGRNDLVGCQEAGNRRAWFLTLYGNSIRMLKCSFQFIDHEVEICADYDRLKWNIWTPLFSPGARSTPGHSHPHLPKSNSRHSCLDRYFPRVWLIPCGVPSV